MKFFFLVGGEGNDIMAHPMENLFSRFLILALSRNVLHAVDSV